MKKCILMITVFFACLLCINSVEAKSLNINDGVMTAVVTTQADMTDEFDHNCADFATTIRIGGYLILLVKIAVPIAMIVKASLSLISVIMSGKAEDFNKSIQKMGIMVVAAVFIFFIPTIIDVTFGIVSDYNDKITEDSRVCSACLFDPFSATCSQHADKKVGE